MAIHNIYMHLIDGQPVYWDKREKALLFCRDGVHRTDMFREKLSQIYDEQRQDAEQRKQQGLSNWGTYGYLRVRVGDKS